MSEIITVGLDPMKSMFQAHGADASGRAILRRALRRDQVLAFFGQLHPLCVREVVRCSTFPLFLRWAG
jgi:transposase